MNKKTLALGLIAIILLIFVAKAAYDSISGEQSANAILAISYQLDDIILEDGDSIAWGTIYINNTESKSLNATNHSDKNYTICFLCSGLPSGWIQTWSCNNTLLEAGKSMCGNLTLTATTEASATWSWEITIT